MEVLPTTSQFSRHGKHKNLNYYRGYYQKNRERLLAYSKKCYGVKKFSFTGTRNITYSNIHKESYFFFKGDKRKRTRREILEECLNRELVRLATKLTKESKCQPIKKGWTYSKFREWLTKDRLLELYQQWSIRGGTRIGKKYLAFVDVDIEQEKFATWLKKQLRKNIMLFLKSIGVCYIETKRGFHIPVLSDELLANKAIYHIDSWRKVKRNIGSIQSKGKFVIGFDSPDKVLVANQGKCFWQVKGISELAQTLAKFFFTIEYQEKIQQLHTDFACFSNPNQKVSQINQKNAKKQSQLPQKAHIKLAEIIKKELFKSWIKREKPIYKLWYQQSGKSPRYFLLDTYQKHRQMVIDRLPIGKINSFILNQGQPYQFFYGFG